MKVVDEWEEEVVNCRSGGAGPPLPLTAPPRSAGVTNTREAARAAGRGSGTRRDETGPWRMKTEIKGGQRKKRCSSSSFSASDYVRCVRLFELADDLNVEHEISPVDVLHHVVQAILQGANTRRRSSQADGQHWQTRVKCAMPTSKVVITSENWSFVVVVVLFLIIIVQPMFLGQI